MICFSFITFFLLLALTVNIGIYIHDKINLQNAADAGSYAGASEQARILQEIGYANYEIRQLYKRFVYDYRYRFSIDNDRDPVVSPSVCVNIPFCDCVVRQSKDPRLRPYGEAHQKPVCGSKADREREMVVGTHGQSPLMIHQMPWNIGAPYDCEAQTDFNHEQALEIKNYYTGELQNLKKLRALLALLNERDGRAEKIARATIRANLSIGNRMTEIAFPKPRERESAPGLGRGHALALTKRLPTYKYRIYYTVWKGPVSRPWCFYKGKPNCMIYTCIRHHAGAFVDMEIPGIWFLKDPNLTTYFMTRLTRKETEFPFAFDFFSRAPEMSAVSAAKPFGSSIGWPDPYSEDTIVPELYTLDDINTPYEPGIIFTHRDRSTTHHYVNEFKRQPAGIINPSYIDFMEAFYWFDREEQQSLTGEFMPIPLVARSDILNRLHFTFDAEAFPGLSNQWDRVRFETSWPYDPGKGIRGRSGYSVKFVAIGDLGTRYRGQPQGDQKRGLIEH